MRSLNSFGLLALGLMACTEETVITEFTYGGGQPGAALAEGGEIRHENVRLLGYPEMTWIQVYQYTGPSAMLNAPFAAPKDKGMGVYGPCADLRDPTTAPWPAKPIAGATFLDLPKVALTGPGITGTLNVVKTDPPNTVGNSTSRLYDFTYGGGQPGDPNGFNSTLTAAQSTPGGEYTLDIGKKDKDGNATPMTYNVPPAYTTPLGIGGADVVMIPNNADLEYSWTPPANDFGADMKTHNKKTWFNFTFFSDPTAAFPPQFICFPDDPAMGHQFIPAAVISALPAGGLIVHATLTHFMESREAAPGEQRRFDLVGIYCNISAFQKQ